MAPKDGTEKIKPNGEVIVTVYVSIDKKERELGTISTIPRMKLPPQYQECLLDSQ